MHRLDRRRVCDLLIVEDDDGMRALLARAGAHCGHRVQSAADVAEGLKAFEETSFDLVITDYSLPDGTGAGLVRELQERLREHMPPVLLVTATLDEVEEDERDLFYAALNKPFRLAQLFDRLEEMRGLVKQRRASGVVERDDAARIREEILRRRSGTD